MNTHIDRHNKINITMNCLLNNSNSYKISSNTRYKDNYNTNLKLNDNISNHKFNILMRCTYRPGTFEHAIKSILLQQYNNYHIYICYDDPDCLQYLKKYLNHPNITITTSPNVPRNSKFFYNLYCNYLLEFVTNGWFLFLDDDDMLMSPKTLLTISKNINYDNDIIFWKVKIGNYIVYPKNFSKFTLGDVSGIGFCINYKYKSYGKWIDKSCSDYSYITQINNSGIKFNHKMIPEVLTGTISMNCGNLGKKEKKNKIIAV